MGKKILVVDNDPEIIKLLVLTLEEEGYEITTAEDGQEALEKMEKDLPDLITSDIVMPRCNGFLLCEKVKKDKKFRNIPFILLTSRPEDTDRYYDEYLEPDAYINKQKDVKELLEKIKELIGS